MQHQQDHMHDNLSWDEPSTGQPVERWDDDDFANLDDIQFRAASTASSAASWQHNQPGHNDRRDSLFSRLSARSDRGSNQDDQDWDVVVDQSSQFQRVPPARIKEITAPGEDPLREVIWSSVGSHTCYTANIDGSDFFSLNKRILRADQARGRRILGVCSAK